VVELPLLIIELSASLALFLRKITKITTATPMIIRGISMTAATMPPIGVETILLLFVVVATAGQKGTSPTGHTNFL
jgi:hypothetical protein